MKIHANLQTITTIRKDDSNESETVVLVEHEGYTLSGHFHGHDSQKNDLSVFPLLCSLLVLFSTNAGKVNDDISETKQHQQQNNNKKKKKKKKKKKHAILLLLMLFLVTWAIKLTWIFGDVFDMIIMFNPCMAA